MGLEKSTEVLYNNLNLNETRNDMLNIYLSMLNNAEEQTEFERLYLKHRSKMYHIALSKLNNNTDAEDAVHEAFLRAAKNFQRIMKIPCNKRGAFLDVIVRNVAVDMFKARTKQGDSLDDEDAPMPVDTATPVDEAALGAISAEELMSFISTLPEALRDVLTLSAFSDMSNKEIAAFLGISENHAAVRLFRARKAVAEFIKR